MIANVTVDGTRLEQVNRIRYLGCVINGNGDRQVEIKSRIERACAAFKSVEKVPEGPEVAFTDLLASMFCVRYLVNGI